ncbi:Signal transduction histidine kinase [Maribacter aquivivus]|uniref:histidine kinase n=2 Tax=Maribacter aquivivus TaxID=228958 RepID=A0A1M6NDV0_9FLAO|nr:Signal transduction histidine kinase [Maribacter aquivivus]
MLISLYIPLLALTVFLYYTQKQKQIAQLSEFQARATSIKIINFKKQLHSFLNNTHYWSTLEYPKDFDPMGRHEAIMLPYLEMIKKITDYDQFRIINLHGKEIFRAVRQGTDSIVVGNLQNKRERDYVKAGLALKRNELYLSQIGLNRENGVIEKPYKPVIRSIAPIFDIENNQIGLVVINFKMKRILDQLKSRIVQNNIYLLDKNSNIITASTSSIDIPYEIDNKGKILSEIRSAKFKTLTKDSSYVDGDHIWSQQALVLSGPLKPYGSSSKDSLTVITPTNWVFAQETPPSVIEDYLSPVYESLMIFNIITILVLFGLSYIYQKNREQKELFYKELESKNILLTRSKDQLEENNVMVNEMNNSLEIRNKQLSDFSYLISHNLRSPVTSMSVIVEMIQKEKNPEILHQLLPKLDKVAKSITNLTEDINDYVSILDTKEIKIVDIDLQELILEVKNEFTETLLDNSGFEVQLNLAAWNHISYSKFYMQSIVHNFISNAIKYKRENVSSYIQFESAIENKHKVLYVRDNGIGLNMERHGDNVFKLYKRFHRNISGKGMGLFLVKSQLDALNATITINSKEGVGTTFKLIF